MTWTSRLLVVAILFALASITLAAGKETVTIDFAAKGEEITHKASGFARALTLTDPPQEMLAGLRPVFFRQPALDSPAKYGALAVYPRSKSLNATESALLSDGVKFDGKFPGEKGNWDKWDKGVADLVRRAMSSGQRVQWEIWSEPNLGSSWKGSKEDYLVLWYRTVKRIRSIDPNAIIAGPGAGPFDAGWIGGFLKVAKEYEVLPDVICWHEKDPKGDIVAHVDQIENDLWQDGHGIRPIIIYQNVPEPARYSPGFAVWTIAGQERSKAQFGVRNKTGEHGLQMASLLSAKSEPRSTWWVYREYARMPGRMIKVSKSGTVDGLATWESGSKTIHILVGRGRRYVPTARAGWIGVVKHPIASLTGSLDWVWDKFETTGIPEEGRSWLRVITPFAVNVANTADKVLSGPTTKPADALGEVELKLTHLPAASVHVIAQRLEYSGEKASKGPQKALEKDLKASEQKEVRFILPAMGEADAYIVTINGL
ncbi:MAG TPA: hypothetical protein VGQ99_11165 [Tepidisphaeraceae bacterium]|nr:hypothetical protein [Tepidisphaeraceae bacterium]